MNSPLVSDNSVDRQNESQQNKSLPVNFTIRHAVEADQKTIRTIIHEADINPMNLDWPRFVVAEADGEIVGVGQVKPHGDGSRELASIATREGYQKQGIATKIIETLMAEEKEPLYLMCEQHNERFYERFGFRRITRKEAPRYFRRIMMIYGTLLPLYKLFTKQNVELVVMKQKTN